MMTPVLRVTIAVLALSVGDSFATAQNSVPLTEIGDHLLEEYFEFQTSEKERSGITLIRSAEEWNQNKEKFREQLQEMLGLKPWPERTPLDAQITGTVEHNDFIVENVHFQSSPKLYVTGNVYRPKQQDGPLPAILYVCGHGRVKKDGVSYGNKTHYQHHGAWFARNGYVCLTIDTIQLGEIEGLHHGTYREGMWWWNNRGYTPAGVEAWNSIRAVDYLQSREEVDGERIGVTGRSGGGAYSWWAAALDERIKVAVPVAGITSMRNHIVDGCIEGHCDCMYMVNSYGWDFPMVAALVAPRPLLISNTDKDRIFPLDGVVDVYNKTRRIYDLLDATDHIGLNIAEGPHKDIQELRIHAFHWFDRFLKGEEQLISSVAEKEFEPEQLKVFESLPEDEKVTNAHEWFVPKADGTSQLSQNELHQLILGRPKAGSVENIRRMRTMTDSGHDLTIYKFLSETPYDLSLATVMNSEETKVRSIHLHLLSENGLEGLIEPQVSQQRDSTPSFKLRKDSLAKIHDGELHAYFAPRGFGSTKWSGDERRQTHIRRRFNLLGRSLDSTRIWDVVQAVEALRRIHMLHYDSDAEIPIELIAEGRAADWAIHAAIVSDNIQKLDLQDVSKDYQGGPEILQIARHLTMSQTLELLKKKEIELKFREPPDE